MLSLPTMPTTCRALAYVCLRCRPGRTFDGGSDPRPAAVRASRHASEGVRLLEPCCTDCWEESGNGADQDGGREATRPGPGWETMAIQRFVERVDGRGE